MVTHLFTFHLQVRHYWITVEILDAKDDVATAAHAEPVYINVTVSPAASSTIVVPEPTVAAGVIVMLLPAVVQIIVLICPVTPAASAMLVAPPDESTSEIAVETETAEEEFVKLSVPVSYTHLTLPTNREV